MAYPYATYTTFDFNTVMQQWSSIGLFDLVLPIILIFTVVFAILQRVKILGGTKGVDAVVALVISFFAIINPEVSGFFIPLFSNVAIGISILLAFLLIVGLIMGEVDADTWRWISLIGGAAIFFWVMSRAAEYFGGYIIFSSQWWLSNGWWLVPAILFGVLMAFVVNASPKENKKKDIKALRDFFVGN